MHELKVNQENKLLNVLKQIQQVWHTPILFWNFGIGIVILPWYEVKWGKSHGWQRYYKMFKFSELRCRIFSYLTSYITMTILYVKGTLMQIWKSCYIFVFI